MSLPLNDGVFIRPEPPRFPMVRLADRDVRAKMRWYLKPEKVLTSFDFLDFLESTARGNGARSFPMSIRELSTAPRPLNLDERASLHLICERWGDLLGEKNQRLIIDVFLGRVEPGTADQEQAVERLRAALMEYVDENSWSESWSNLSEDELWRGRYWDEEDRYWHNRSKKDSEKLSETQWQIDLTAHTLERGEKLWDAAALVLLAWGSKVPRHYKAPLAYLPIQHFSLVMPRGANSISDDLSFKSPLSIAQEAIDTYLLYSAEELRDTLLGRDRSSFIFNEWGARNSYPLDDLGGAFSEDELMLLRNMGEGLAESPDTLMALAPHLPSMTWSSLLELAVVAGEYNVEWALAAKE